MKYVTSFLLLFLFVDGAVAQEDDAGITRMKKQWTADIEAEMSEKGIGVSDPDEWTMEYDSLFDMYERDTFLLQRLFEYQLDYDQTTSGMVAAIHDCEVGYDALLNKYYKLLMARLDGPDKEVLRKSQRNWVAFRDSEKELNFTLTEEKYSGGGTIQRLNYASRNLATVQRRVEELFYYLIP